MSIDLAELQNQIKRHKAIARVTVLKSSGSTPRDAGASMNIWANGQSGTIGGGALEYKATEIARKRLAERITTPHLETVPLGPNLGQCCGGSVTLLTRIFDEDTYLPLNEDQEYLTTPLSEKYESPCDIRDKIKQTRSEILISEDWVAEKISTPLRKVWIYGAGHVGRSIVICLAPLPEFTIIWLDTNRERFPDTYPDNVDILVANDLSQAVTHAPDDAEHFVLTYSHAIDLQICSNILSKSFRSVGLIGSSTKWARFRKRLIELGHEPHIVDRISCPIGNTELGKHPQSIAIGVVAELILSSNSSVK